MGKRTLLAILGISGALLSAAPCLGAVNLLDRLMEKGILTQAERDELRKDEPKVKVDYKDNFYFATTDNKFRLDLYGYGQARYTFTDKDEAENTDNASVQRLRIGLKGYAFTEALRFGVLLNVISGGSSVTGTDLFDYFVDYVPLPEIGVKVGQYKVPFATSWNISAANMQFVERTTADATFRFDRDVGVDLHGALFASVLSYDIGIFNGEGRNKNNSNDKHLYVGRLSVEPFGKYPYHESDNEISKSFLLLASAAIAYDDDVSSHTVSNLSSRLTALGESDVKSFNGFLGLKFRGASVHGEYYHRRISSKAKGEESARGLYAQGGYFVYADKVEVAGRYELLDPNGDTADDLTQEYGVGVNYFFAGHRNKLQADLFRVNQQKPSAASLNDNRLRVQWTLQF